jgi:transcriptional regulator with XRE-family HTH domain
MSQQITYNGLVGFELERIRKELGKEQSEISMVTGISQPVLSRLEKGKAMITIDQLFVVCGALGVKPESIISKASKGVAAFSTEEAVNVTTTKEASAAGAVLTGAAIGALLTLFLTKGK